MGKPMNKRHYTDLPGSLECTLYLLLGLLCLAFGIYSCYVKSNGALYFVIFILLLVIVMIFIIMVECYHYWILLDDLIVFKTIYSKRIIKIAEIEKVEKKEVGGMVGSGYRRDCESYIIYSHNTKIVIPIEGKKYPELDCILEKILSNWKGDSTV